MGFQEVCSALLDTRMEANKSVYDEKSAPKTTMTKYPFEGSSAQSTFESGRQRTRGVRGIVLLILLPFVAAAVGCAGSAPIAQDTIDAQRAIESQKSKQDLNRKLTSAAVSARTNQKLLYTDYPIGGGDVLEVSVFGVDELNTTARVSRGGMILLPLVGELKVGGRSLREVEELLAEALTEYMHDPDVSVFVAEYHSQQVSVTGAVQTPAMHSLTRPRTVLELVSMSGGLSPEAGEQIYVQTSIDGAPHNLIIDLDDALSDPDNPVFQMLLGGGDSVFVPEAGVAFVEGAVNQPGSYSLKGGAGIVEVIAMARGTTFDARESEVQVITTSDDGERVVISVELDKVRANQAPNYYLEDGDIVVVPSNAVKKSVVGFWRGFQGIFGMGYSINGP